MANCRACGAPIIFVDKGTDPNTGRKKWVPVNEDLSPHVCGQAPATGGAQPAKNGNGFTTAYEVQQAAKERRICAMWSIGQAVTLTAGAPMDLDARLGKVEEYARRLFALVDLVAAGEPVPSPATPQAPAEVHA